MEKEELYSYVDHTALKAFTTWDEIDKLCKEAIEHKMASVCIPSCYIAKVHEKYPNLPITTVIGFPLGNCSTTAKIAEAKKAVSDGASDIDLVINIGAVKNEDYTYVQEEIKAIRAICQDQILKVIIETCYLTEAQIIQMSKIVTACHADYIKTSTGFGTKGATLDNVRLMKKYIGQNVKIKAAGGIRTREEMEQYIEEGCSRIGTSSAISMLEG
ncbi:deoxyribose-phosphate aldolase [Eubacterium oxidoreducens]|uniref:Deoxyribose-phosphate aldolase n=1 Tax=Eubacterium oxidoreducens TaxID=1732 RepID=A0A1G6AKG2_EUBOX|nr:deoxyribose-phosphate aldolase [Eubacterium oxidoreducens]SDB08866.1 deoxyribose-phosphate aldolase [Eubacterium oxidoreducens]